MSRRLPLALGLVALLGGAHPAAAVVDVSGPPLGIAVVPFANGGVDPGSARSRTRADRWPDVAGLLADELSTLSTTRVVAPRELRHDERGLRDPQARDVRRWARWNAVENVVVGRLQPADSRTGYEIDVELRSGHSGAPRASYRLEPALRSDLDGVIERLAHRILADLGETADTTSDLLPGVSAAGPPAAPASGEAPSGDEVGPQGDDLGLFPGGTSDDPISINSDELEVLPQDGGRRLVFSRNVVVEQGDIVLNADRLEAVYPEGASQPDLLLASGRVRVAQGERRGRCDEATYRRQGQTIVCRGHAEVLQGCDQVRGEEIEFDLVRRRVRVSGAASVLIQPDGEVPGECGPAKGASDR